MLALAVAATVLLYKYRFAGDATLPRTRQSLSAGVTLTPNERSKPLRCFSPTAWLLDASLPIPRVLAGQVPRLQRYYQGTATSCRPSHRVSFPSLSGTTGSRRFRSRRRCVRQRRAWGWSLGIPLRDFPWKRQDLPSSWGTPIPVCTWSPTPAGRNVPDQLRNVRMAPAKCMTKAPTRRLSRLNSMAFGLAAYVSRDGYPPDRARLASRCWSLSWTGFYPQSSFKRFQLTSCLSISFSKLLGTNTFAASKHRRTGPRDADGPRRGPPDSPSCLRRPRCSTLI